MNHSCTDNVVRPLEGRILNRRSIGLLSEMWWVAIVAPALLENRNSFVLVHHRNRVEPICETIATTPDQHVLTFGLAQCRGAPTRVEHALGDSGDLFSKKLPGVFVESDQAGDKLPGYIGVRPVDTVRSRRVKNVPMNKGRAA